MNIEGAYDDTNIFAKILRGEAPAVKLYEDGAVLAFMDLFPQSIGHVLVIPKQSRTRNILDVPPTVLADLMGIVQKIARAAHIALRPDGIIVGQFNGQAAGQTVDHLHFHVIPCWTGQPLKGHGQAQKADTGDLLRVAKKIAAALTV
jgi:histidine triad (HIT) family protein